MEQLAFVRKATTLKFYIVALALVSVFYAPPLFVLLKRPTVRNGPVLVIVIGTIRGGEYAWKSFRELALQQLDADLAYMGPDDPQLFNTTRMKYNWHVEDYEDWGSVFDSIDDTGRWRKLCYHPVPGGIQLLGGVKHCHEGSAGILLAYRELLLQKIEELQLPKDYKWFILTRSDHYYLCPHITLENLAHNAVNVVEGEGYGGVTDRHSVMHGDIVGKALGVTRYVVKNFDEMLSEFNNGTKHVNLEAVLQHYFEAQQLITATFKRTFFAVKRAEDHTRWSQGIQHEVGRKYELQVKYTSALELAEKSCGSTWLQSYEAEMRSRYCFNGNSFRSAFRG